MAPKEYPIINIICHSLPYDLSNQLYHEFENRFKEVKWLITNRVYYHRRLQSHLKTVELLLALSIFHKRVVSNLDAVLKFYRTVNSKSQADTISIGRYQLDGTEKNKLDKILKHYLALKLKFGLENYVFEYYETREFLDQVIRYRSSLGNKRK